jgi:POT family proton-dependent oligopeptide transporter
MGRNRYIRSPPTGSVLSAALRLWFFAAKDRWTWNPIQLWRNLTAPDFWDSAKPSRQRERPSWMMFDDNWVDEVGRGFAACGVFLWFPVYCTCTTLFHFDDT